MYVSGIACYRFMRTADGGRKDVSIHRSWALPDLMLRSRYRFGAWQGETLPKAKSLESLFFTPCIPFLGGHESASQSHCIPSQNKGPCFTPHKEETDKGAN